MRMAAPGLRVGVRVTAAAVRAVAGRSSAGSCTRIAASSRCRSSPGSMPSSSTSSGSRVPVGGQRVGLPPGPVQGEHQQAAQGLAKGMLADQSLQLGNGRGVVPEREVGLEPALERQQPQLPSRSALVGGEVWEPNSASGARATAPEPPEAGRGGRRVPPARWRPVPRRQGLEPGASSVVRGEAQPIAAGPGLEDPSPSASAAARRSRGRSWWPCRRAAGPELVDEGLGGDDLSGAARAARARRVASPRRP